MGWYVTHIDPVLVQGQMLVRESKREREREREREQERETERDTQRGEASVHVVLK